MTAFEEMQAKLADASDLDSVMISGWQAFELIYFVTHKYGGMKSDSFATWMWAMGPAGDGTGALEPGPSHREPPPSVDAEDLAGVSEKDAFLILDALAVQLHGKLIAAARDPRPERVHDASACARAAASASELHGLFRLD